MVRVILAHVCVCAVAVLLACVAKHELGDAERKSLVCTAARAQIAGCIAMDHSIPGENQNLKTDNAFSACRGGAMVQWQGCLKRLERLLKAAGIAGRLRQLLLDVSDDCLGDGQDTAQRIFPTDSHWDQKTMSRTDPCALSCVSLSIAAMEPGVAFALRRFSGTLSFHVFHSLCNLPQK